MKILRYIAAIAVSLAIATPAMAIVPTPFVTSSSGAIVFGVAPYGAPVPGVPTYFANNFTGLNDIMTSPGGTFQTANPIIANNLANYAPLALPAYAFQIGGANGSGNFGAGQIYLTPTNVGFTMQDSFPGGGSASYGIASVITNFSVGPGGYNGAFGTYLAIGGILPDVNSAGAVSIRTHVSSANPTSPFFGGYDYPQLVLAAGRLAGNTYTTSAFGGLTGTKAGISIDNAVLGTFRGLAIDNLSFNIPANDVFTATSTITIYADPMSCEMIDPGTNLDLLTLPTLLGESLPSQSALGFASVPEPSTYVLGGFGIVALIAFKRRKKNA